MKISAARAALVLLSLPLAGVAAEKPTSDEESKAVALEDAKKAAKTPPATAAKSPDKNEKAAPTKMTPNVVTTPVARVDPKAPPELEGKLPRVDVTKSRVTQLDHDLHEQDRAIALEKRNTKATELDGALNSASITPSILGGYSSKARTGIAQERVELMEFEKELIEAIARAKTKEEKAALKKQLDDIRLMRRTLDGPAEQKSRAGK